MSSSDNDTVPPPSEALMQLLAPDGYYVYLSIPKMPSGEVDADLIKKNYRKLSLKHHPDKRGGDAETFRVLNRAQKVLTNTKVRQQYDILGLDLDDDEEQTTNNEENEEGGQEQQTTSQGIVHEVASMALTSVLQMGVRTRTCGSGRNGD
jgi:DnaJ-class molecular chaperone